MRMRIFWSLLLAATVGGLVTPSPCPAPLVWRKGEGWTYERHGVTTAAGNPADQLKLGQEYQARKEYRNALSSYRRLLRRWPTAAAAQDAQFGIAECLSAIGYHYRAFQEYQNLLKKHPDTKHFDAVLQRQFEIGNLFLAGERDKAWGVRWFKAPEKALEIYEQVIKNGPFSPVAPEAQYRIGQTQETLKEYLLAVKAYEKVIERYPRHTQAEMAAFAIGRAYQREAQRAEYDQNAANQSIIAFTDFLVRYPQSERAPLARQYLIEMQQEQARGLFQIARFYEKQHKLQAALVYYNEILERAPQTTWAPLARAKVESLNLRLSPPSPAQS